MKTTTERPASPLDASAYIPTGIGPEDFFKALAELPRLRKEAEAEVERLIEWLDQTDIDTDLEPSLAGYSPGMDDREGDGCDDEPSLGWTAREASIGRHYAGSLGDGIDQEDNPDDEGVMCSGIGDFDGLMEQVPELFAHCDVRVEA